MSQYDRKLNENFHPVEWMKEHVHSLKNKIIYKEKILFILINHTSHFFNLTHGWKLTSSSKRGLTNDNVKSGIPLNLTQQSI